MSASIFGRVDGRSTWTFAFYFLTSVAVAASCHGRTYAAETRSQAKASSSLATMSERVGPPAAARDISLLHFAANRDSGLAANLGSTMAAEVVGGATASALDAPLAALRPTARGTTLEAAANHRGFGGSNQASAPGARRGMLQASGVAMTMPAVMKFGLNHETERVRSSETSVLSRGRETAAYAVDPSVAAAGGAYRAAVFSAAAVIEPPSQALPAAASTQLFFSTEPVNGPLQPMGVR